MKGVIYNLPLIAALFIAGLFAAIDAGLLPGLRNERTFGWFLVVWFPLAAVLLVVQLLVWIGWAVRRRRR